MEIRYIDLFGGIGGFRLGIERAEDGFKCVWYNDIDKYATKIYNERFQESYEPRDIRTIHESRIPKHDLICAGFPCQSFSIAGKQQGFEDTRGTLFFEICRVARFHRPRYLLLENVKGLLSHNEGQTFTTILLSLQELGYSLEWECLNSKNFGVPQSRERVFIIGHLGGFSGQQVFPIREDKEDNIWQMEGIQSYCLTKASAGGMNKKGTYIEHDDMRTRRLTPIECERLQGFPDGWTAGVSDTQRYKMLGNAVTVNVIESIINSFKRTLKNDS